jgi:hypothetical protein
MDMDSNWAVEHLQVIRTLMERSAVYRRALAPIMIYNGVLGLVFAGIGMFARIFSPPGFILFWGVVCVVALSGSFLLVRRQALKAGEPFWSPPTRRVSQAMLPPVVTGALLGSLVLGSAYTVPAGLTPKIAFVLLPSSWIILYGFAFHAAGFFMPRGMKLFGWMFVIGGCLAAAPGIVLTKATGNPLYAHALMGCFFGALHLAYGAYLHFTEPAGNAS